MFKITFGCVFQMFTLMSFSSPAMITSNISAKYPLRISNGEPAYLGEIPYQIALKLASDSFRFRYYTICGGALIGNSKILTAAHCFFSEKARGRVFEYLLVIIILISRETTTVEQKPPIARHNERQLLTCCPHLSYAMSDERIQLSRLCAVAGTLRNIGYYGWDGGVEQWRRLNVTVIHPSFKFPDNDIAVVQYLGRPRQLLHVGHPRSKVKVQDPIIIMQFCRTTLSHSPYVAEPAKSSRFAFAHNIGVSLGGYSDKHLPRAGVRGLEALGQQRSGGPPATPA
ncbi:hypothetical protein MSG28_005262 [Choristoneura fumiferana]|uniref:Uncharacterized protein n=1 Tax=Choristoneura fumiferana TaxID=7141 RepID=A0ACC0JQR8_CHOFU|nr:hypothetical protein MSG28_005262 [Choristoneura fumiferana]